MTGPWKILEFYIDLPTGTMKQEVVIVLSENFSEEGLQILKYLGKDNCPISPTKIAQKVCFKMKNIVAKAFLNIFSWNRTRESDPGPNGPFVIRFNVLGYSWSLPPPAANFVVYFWFL